MNVCVCVCELTYSSTRVSCSTKSLISSCYLISFVSLVRCLSSEHSECGQTNRERDGK
jgi:hypothetical protein